MPPVTISVIDWLTLALVLATIYYAWQTRQTVEELRRARGVAILPRLVASIHAKGGGVGFVNVANVGPGPALDVHAVLTFEPGGGPVEWRNRIVAPGEAHDLNPQPDGTGGDKQYDLDILTERFTHLRLTGTYSDALGDTHKVDEAVEIREWWRALKASKQHIEHVWPEESAKALGKIAKGIEELVGEARGAGRTGESGPPLEQRIDAIFHGLAADADTASDPGPGGDRG